MKVEKSYEITDAKISFVSLVDKAANKKQFLITKAEKGDANFTTYGRILKVDDDNHYITGVVYEPMVEDSHGNFMTEEAIVKAAYWFAKNGDKVDLQHSFEALSDATVVENWVTKSDTTIEGEEIKKGTWLMTVEISDTDVWDKIQKGEITGFSMGGVGKYSEEDVDLNNVEKGAGESMNTDTTEKKGIFKKLAEAFGLDVVEKGAMTDEFNRRTKANQFWSAFSTLEDLLRTWDWRNDTYVFETDEETIRQALEEFSTILTTILTQDSITKALAAADKPIQKAGKKMSTANKKKLDEINQALSDFAKEFDENEEEEESEVKKEDIQNMINEAIKKAVEPKSTEVQKQDEPLTAEAVEKMITDSISKALDAGNEGGQEEVKKDELTADKVQEMITKAIEPILKSRGLPTNLNADGKPIQKDENHYLKGIL